MRLSRIMAEPEQLTEYRGTRQALYARLGGGAIGLAVLAVVIALIEPAAPASFLGGGRGVFLLLLLVLAISAAAVRGLVEWRWGKAPLAGPWWIVLRAKNFFMLALLGALPALGLVTVLVWMAGEPWAGLLGRGWLVLLVGGAFVGITGNLVAHLLFLMLPRRH